jgi:SNF family Na+-dependent transporter
VSFQEPVKEQWGTRIGLVLAMAGNAVGLGNFLRFPVQAAQNGGGTFMIPYFISFLLLGIPMMWIEWGVGRYGGQYGHGSVPGMFDVLTDRRRKWAKYLGILGVVMPLVVFIYYTYVASWMLGFSFFSITGRYFGLGDDVQARAEGVRTFLSDYQNIYDSTSAPGWLPVLFFGLTMVFLGWVLARGISGGIEKLALYGVPLLFLFAIVLLVRILTLPPAAAAPSDGLNFIWSPDWQSLGNARVWVAAAGQMFFTLSVGMGIIQTYASYLKKKDDVTLTGLSTAATNAFAEVVLGGTLAIPAAVVFFGVAGATAIATSGSFDLGIVAMGTVFGEMAGSQFWAFMWFFLLFIAGITSCVALASPTMAFLQEHRQFGAGNELGQGRVAQGHRLGRHQRSAAFAAYRGVVQAFVGNAVGGAAGGADQMHGAAPQAPGRAPSLRMMVSIRHHFVSALCSRFTPTKAVKARNQELTKIGLPGMPSASDSRIRLPATRRTSCQDVMVLLLVG